MESSLKEKLLMLQESDFAADDIKLYLDTHPNDNIMMMKLYIQIQKSMILRNEIETRYGYPLTASSAVMHGAPFRWINAPWPWSPSWPGAVCQNMQMASSCSLNRSENCEEQTGCINETETEGCK